MTDGLTLSPVRLGLYAAYCLLMFAAFFWANAHVPSQNQTASLALAFVIGVVVPVCIAFRKDIDLLEPIYWFALMYYVFFVGAVYFILTDFEFSSHLLIVDRIERDRSLLKALVLVLAGYIAFVFSYFFATRQTRRARIVFPSKNTIPGWLQFGAIAALFAVGLFNFYYLIANYPGGLFRYYSEIGLRTHRLEAYGAQVTTAGLQLVYTAVWFWMYALMRRKQFGNPPSRIHLFAFGCAAIASVAILGSQGRLFLTVSYCLVIAGMFYAHSTSTRRNSGLLFGGSALIIGGLALYLGRLLSVFHYNQPDLFAQFSLGELFALFVRTLNTLILDSGNVTDLTSLMNIVAFWERDFGFLYGSSFAAFIPKFVPGIEVDSVAQMSKNDWSTGVGAWPPTFIGELFANFGSVGVVSGMLVAGFLTGKVYLLCTRFNTFWSTLILASLSFRLFFILPKGETANLAGAIWTFLPALIALGFIALIITTLRPTTPQPHSVTRP